MISDRYNTTPNYRLGVFEKKLSAYINKLFRNGDQMSDTKSVISESTDETSEQSDEDSILEVDSDHMGDTETVKYEPYDPGSSNTFYSEPNNKK